MTVTVVTTEEQMETETGNIQLREGDVWGISQKRYGSDLSPLPLVQRHRRNHTVGTGRP